MGLPQRFSRLPSEEPREEQETVLPAFASQITMETMIDKKSDITTNVRPNPDTTSGSHAAGKWDTPGYTISHRRTLIDQLEEFEHRRIGTRFIGRFYDIFVAGWRAGLLRAFLLSLIALIINIAVYAWLYTTFDTHQGSATIIRGSCTAVHNANTGIHAALNLLSTLVLGASTYAMQGLTAPLRSDVNAAHAKGKWVEIGTSSVRNLFYVRRRNVWIWGVLALSSLPFHLFFNAVFFTTTQTNQYAVAVIDASYFSNTNFRPAADNASPDLFNPKSYANNICNGAVCTYDIRNVSRVTELLQDVRSVTRNAKFLRMEAQECMQNYSSGFLRDYSDVVVVSTDTGANSPLLWTRYPQRSISNGTRKTNRDPFHWVCNDVIDPEDSKADRCSLEMAMERFDSGRSWTVSGHPVSHCFARTTFGTCNLQFNAFLMIGVVVFGVIKVLMMAYLAFNRPAGRFLRTIGDAIASFLEEEDPTTKNMCLVTSKQIRKHGFQTPYEPQIYTGVRSRWLSSANTTEFFTTIGISAFYILILSIALFFAIDGAKGMAFAPGLGTPDIQSLASFKRDDTGSSGIVPTLLIANIPQLGFSILYVVYSNIWAKLLVAKEFDNMTTTKKRLRMSERPKGMQRASRFTTLPIRYAVPLMGCSAALHWLCSQSFFMVRIDGVDARGDVDESDQLVRLGYSATGVVALIGVSVGGMVATVCMAVFRRASTPLGETSMSVVLSAACHRSWYEAEPWLREVQWGDVTEDGEERGIRHCAFTTGMVERPIVGRLYR